MIGDESVSSCVADMCAWSCSFVAIYLLVAIYLFVRALFVRYSCTVRSSLVIICATVS